MQIDDILGNGDTSLGQLLDAIAEMNDQDSLRDFFARLHALFTRTCSTASIAAFEFGKDLQPHLIFVDGPNGGDDLPQYLGGLYLLDPFYLMYTEEEKTGVFVMSQTDSETFGVAKKYKAYWSRITGDSEIAALFPAGPGKCLHVTIMVRNDQQLAQRTVLLVRLLEKTIVSFFRRKLERGEASNVDDTMRRHVHLTVNRTLQSFGADVLTDRERDVVQLLLKGHSAKSIAQLLDISAGTAGIHRSNIYRKLEITGQGELFLKYLNLLSQE
ncbi:MAG: LuxR C-terminal-related transcriptional regulator [Albidovulum sp.]|uniref:helix-turn-helix transcriptional regulator n=1 Tax=Albidovulum sp. TaxID=1872424 RepID=UPI003CA8F310